MMPYIYATALLMDGNNLEWEIRKNNHPTTNYSQVFIYLKGEWPCSGKRKKKKKDKKEKAFLLDVDVRIQV